MPSGSVIVRLVIRRWGSSTERWGGVGPGGERKAFFFSLVVVMRRNLYGSVELRHGAFWSLVPGVPCTSLFGRGARDADLSKLDVLRSMLLFL